MNRRSVLRWLGLAPIAAPAAVAAASAPYLPPIDYSSLARDVAEHIETQIAGMSVVYPKTLDLTHRTLPGGRIEITFSRAD